MTSTGSTNVPEDRQEESLEGKERAEGDATSKEPPSTEALLDEAIRERDQFRALAQRAQADLVNYRRRVEEERQGLIQSASSQLLVRLLPILDDLHRAIEHVEEAAPPAWIEGVRLVQRKLHGVLEVEGVTTFIPETGASFDPLEQEAMFHEPSGEQPAGTVIRTIRPGYKNRIRVLRAAQVVLAQDLQGRD